MSSLGAISPRNRHSLLHSVIALSHHLFTVAKASKGCGRKIESEDSLWHPRRAPREYFDLAGGKGTWGQVHGEGKAPTTSLSVAPERIFFLTSRKISRDAEDLKHAIESSVSIIGLLVNLRRLSLLYRHHKTVAGGHHQTTWSQMMKPGSREPI